MIFMLRLIAKKDLMGRHTNSHCFNLIAWATAVIVIAMSLVMFWNQIRG